MPDINNPHDKFFKENFSQLEITKDFLFHHLPVKIRKHLDLDNIVIQKDSFVDENLQAFYSDLLFSVSLRKKGDVYVYILFEHKSYSDPWVALQLLTYMVKIWNRDVEENNSKPLLGILPIVIYHGESKWHVSTKFIDLFPRNEIFKPFLPNFEYLIYDIPRYDDDDLVGTNKLRLILLLYKYITDKDFLGHIRKIHPLLTKLKEEMYSEDFQRTLLLYIYSVIDQIKFKDMQKIIENQLLLSEGENIMVTIAEHLKQEGWLSGKQEGKQEGLQMGLKEGKVEDIQKILETRFGTISSKICQKLKTIEDLHELNQLFTIALTIDSLPGFQQHLKQSLR